MARGGKREGAGRTKGAVTVRTRKIAMQAAAEGITPVEVMLDNMRFYHQAAGVALDRLLGGASPAEIINEHDPKSLDPENPPNTVEAVKLILDLRQRAGEAAKDAAPYMHARISPIEARDRDKDSVPLADRLKAYATADAIDASEGKVVALKTKK